MKQGGKSDYKIVKIMCSLERGYAGTELQDSQGYVLS